MVTTDEAAPAIAPPTLAPGAVIADRYRIEARLGAGGGGTVFRCRDLELDQPVALKVVSSDGDLERWRREVAMARQITDRNVCRVHDLGETDEVRYVTMELVEGTSLRTKLRAGLPTSEARSVIEQLIAGVAAIHAAGVVHRDLKPENVVVTPDGRAVIVDFGIAKPPRSSSSRAPAVATDRSEAVTRQLKADAPDPIPNPEPRVEPPRGATITREGFAIGTPRYMSPEQANAEPVDARTDIWALGLVAHELLTGELPALDGTVASSVDDRWPGFAAVLRRCVALDAKDRFADARELHAALPGTRRRRLPIAIALVGAVAGGGLLAFALTRGGDHGTPTPPETSSRMLQVTTTLDKQWPKLSPLSVALDATATQLAYTTGGGGVYVRPLAGGAVVEWPAPTIGEPTARSLAAPRVIGWFTDGSLAIVGSTSNSQRLVRLRSTGAVEPLLSESSRFHAAVSRRDKIAIAQGRTIRELGGGELATLPDRSRVVALAWVGDQVAWLRATGDALTLELAGSELWHGTSELVIDPLLAASGDKLMFSFRQRGETTIAVIDAAKQLTVIETTPAHVGAGSISNGALVVVRGTAREVIQLRDRFGNRTSLAHAPTSRGTLVAGWTTSGSVVMRVDDRVVTGTAVASAWQLAPWEGTTATDIPAAVLGDDVLVHHAEGDVWQIERITPAGIRTSFARIPNATALHCASSCVVQQRDGDDAIWSALDDTTHAIARQLHRRKVLGTPDFALDATSLVIVTDGELIAVDPVTGTLLAPPPPAALPTRWAAIRFDGEGQLWAAAESLEVLPFGLVRYRRRADAYSRPSSLVTQKEDVLRLFRAPVPTGADRDMRVAVPTLELALEIWRADAPR